ncbi:MAG TPA: hypothetical protein VGO50_02675 [Pyrinomonadaceae bacterium]|jgi:hypothetical protein|nr:hypothetical protein [Pyrinomonadaceae bacterium]
MQNFQAGDFLLFQVESGYGLLRVLAMDEGDGGAPIWHLAAYEELFLDSEMADGAVANNSLTINIPHIALTNRAFEATQVAKLSYRELTGGELAAYDIWVADPGHEISDTSIRLLLGLR